MRMLSVVVLEGNGQAEWYHLSIKLGHIVDTSAFLRHHAALCHTAALRGYTAGRQREQAKRGGKGPGSFGSIDSTCISNPSTSDNLSTDECLKVVPTSAEQDQAA